MSARRLFLALLLCGSVAGQAAARDGAGAPGGLAEQIGQPLAATELAGMSGGHAVAQAGATPASTGSVTLWDELRRTPVRVPPVGDGVISVNGRPHR